MRIQDIDDPRHAQLTALIAGSRAALVRYCATVSGSPEAAEDLAQETLLEVWRHVSRLDTADRPQGWLFGVARNVCWRWLRRRGREPVSTPHHESQLMHQPVPHDDIDAMIERAAVASALDHALTKLPGRTRDVMELRYLDELDICDIATNLDIDENAVSVRLSRGRKTLRTVLSQEHSNHGLHELGVPRTVFADWRDTRVWCPFCGDARLRLRIEPETHILQVRCSHQCRWNGDLIGGKQMLPASRALRNPKSILNRELVDLHHHYRAAMGRREGRCHGCGAPIPVNYTLSRNDHGESAEFDSYGIALRCGACGAESTASLWHLLIDMPEANRFWRRHPRMRALPVTEVNHEGHEALLGGFESTSSTETLIVISDRATYHPLHIDDPEHR